MEILYGYTAKQNPKKDSALPKTNLFGLSLIWKTGMKQQLSIYFPYSQYFQYSVVGVMDLGHCKVLAFVPQEIWNSALYK